MAGGILVYALHDDEGNFNKNSLGAISEAAKLAGEIGGDAGVMVVGDAINEPRYPSLKAIMGAKKKPLDSKATGEVGIESDKVGEAGSQTQVLAINPPPEKEAGEVFEDEDTNETVEKIVAWLDERKLI